MRPMGDTRAHFWLMMRMSKTVGVDLGEALREGRLSARSYADAVTRCRGCDNAQGCAAWLDQTETAAHTPVYCRNADVFDGLGRA